MGNIHTIPLHLGDFITDTMHLTPGELGAYFRLLVAHYRMGEGGLPSDHQQLRRITGMDNKSWSHSHRTILAFFQLSDAGQYRHGKVLEVLVELAQKKEQNRSKALKRWNQHDAAASIQHCRGNAIHNPISNKRAKALYPPYPPEFEQFWQATPKTSCSKKEAYHAYQRALQKGTTHDELKRGIDRYSEYLRRSGSPAAHATTWLNGERWSVDYDAALQQREQQFRGGPPQPGKQGGAIDTRDAPSRARDIGEDIIAKRRAIREGLARTAFEGQPAGAG